MMYYKYMVKVAKRIWLWLKAHRKSEDYLLKKIIMIPELL